MFYMCVYRLNVGFDQLQIGFDWLSLLIGFNGLLMLSQRFLIGLFLPVSPLKCFKNNLLTLGGRRRWRS